MNVAVAGGAGYVGGELIRLLLQHPYVNLYHVSSRSQEGKAVSDVHTDLLGQTNLKFESQYPQDADVIFIAMGHGKSKDFISKLHNPEDKIIIDLSRDYRLSDDAGSFVYGLCELQKSAIQSSRHIANPGCFATCIQLGLLPLAQAGVIKNDVHVTAITGSTGAGQKPSGTTHFSWRNNNISIYKAFTHQHLDEIQQSIKQLQSSFENEINFIPMRGNFTRGIFASLYLACHLSESDVIELFTNYYKDSPFVHISNVPITVKQVVNTNNAVIYISKYKDKIRIESAIDNLLKGAAGQAVQNLNLVCGWEEYSGLNLKPSSF